MMPQIGDRAKKVCRFAWPDFPGLPYGLILSGGSGSLDGLAAMACLVMRTHLATKVRLAVRLHLATKIRLAILLRLAAPDQIKPASSHEIRPPTPLCGIASSHKPTADK